MEMPLSDTHGDRVRGDFDAGDGRVKKEPGHISPAANALLGVMKTLSCKQTYFAVNALNTPKELFWIGT